MRDIAHFICLKISPGAAPQEPGGRQPPAALSHRTQTDDPALDLF